MKFVWDKNKNIANQAKHGIDFLDAILIFDDPDRIEAMDDRKNYGENRYQTIGMVNNIILYVVYTYRNKVRRIISARRASKDERKTYFEE